MAEQIYNHLYRIAIDTEHTFIYVQADNKQDLIHYLADEVAKEHEIFSARELLKDGTLHTVHILTDPVFESLLSKHKTDDDLHSLTDMIDTAEKLSRNTDKEQDQASGKPNQRLLHN